MTNNLSNTNDYFLFLLPVNTRTIKLLVNELLDMYEYQDSFIYHEYPDKNEILRQLETIYASPTFPDSSDEMKDLAQTIFLYEMLIRRNRYFDIINRDNN